MSGLTQLAGAPIIDESTPTVFIDDESVEFTSDRHSVADGTLVKCIGNGPISLVLDGVRRAYHSRDLLLRVHIENPTVYALADLDAIPDGPRMPDDLELIKVPGSNNPNYLLIDGKKRGIRSLDLFNKYQFDASKVQPVSAGVQDAIQTGSNLPG